jgi:hypothetical protein
MFSSFESAFGLIPRLKSIDSSGFADAALM